MNNALNEALDSQIKSKICRRLKVTIEISSPEERKKLRVGICIEDRCKKNQTLQIKTKFSSQMQSQINLFFASPLSPPLSIIIVF